jgi:hypothetical protein
MDESDVIHSNSHFGSVFLENRNCFGANNERFTVPSHELCFANRFL